MPWCVPIGALQTVRSRAYSAAWASALRPAPIAKTAVMIRSGFSPSKTTLSP